MLPSADVKHRSRQRTSLTLARSVIERSSWGSKSYQSRQPKKRRNSITRMGNWVSLVAEKGFEPHDLRVMSPTSYQTAPLRDIMVPEAGVEPVREKISRDFKSRASANSAIPAWTTLWSSTLPIYYITKKYKSQYLFQKNFQKSKKLFDNLLT